MYLDPSKLTLGTPMARLGVELATRHYWLSRTGRMEADEGNKLGEKVEAHTFCDMQGWTTEDGLRHHNSLRLCCHGPHTRTF